MKKNMGSADRWVRILLAAVFALLYFSNYVTGAAGLILVVLGGIFLLTSVLRFCPLYALFRISTRPKQTDF